MISSPGRKSLNSSQYIFKDQLLKNECVVPEELLSQVIESAISACENFDFSVQKSVYLEIDKPEKKKDEDIWKVIVVKNESTEISLSPWAIDPSRVVGKGGQGEVVLAQNLKTKQWAAVKTILRTSDTYKEDIQRESKNLKRIERCIGMTEDFSNNTHILTDYFSGKNLEDALFTTDPTISKEYPEHYQAKKPLAPLKTARLVFEILDEILFLHDKDIAHRDLKLENFVFDNSKEHRFDVRVIDLGSGIDLRSERSKIIAGTFGWNDPALTDERYQHLDYSFQHDLGSLAIVIAAIGSKYIYPAQIRKKIQEQASLEIKPQLTWNEIKQMMPDMFDEKIYTLEAGSNNLPEIEKRTQIGLMEDIKDIIKQFSLENPQIRPDKVKLKEIRDELQRKILKVTVEMNSFKHSFSSRSTSPLVNSNNDVRIIDTLHFAYSEIQGSSPKKDILNNDYRASDEKYPRKTSKVEPYKKRNSSSEGINNTTNIVTEAQQTFLPENDELFILHSIRNLTTGDTIYPSQEKRQIVPQDHSDDWPLTKPRI